MNEKYNMTVILITLLIIIMLSGCGAYVTDYANGTDRAGPIQTNPPTPNFSAYSGAGQSDEGVRTPSPLRNKTSRDDINVTLVEKTLTKEMNEYRAGDQLSQLETDSRLATIARHHSYDMASRDFFNHTNPDGQNHGDRLEDSSYKCFDSAENIHWTRWNTENRTTEEELAYETILAFMESAPHNEAMLVPQYDTVGIGIFVTEDGQVFVTMLLCI